MPLWWLLHQARCKMLQANTRSLTLTTVFLAPFNAIAFIPVGTLKGDSVWYSPEIPACGFGTAFATPSIT